MLVVIFINTTSGKVGDMDSSPPTRINKRDCPHNIHQDGIFWKKEKIIIMCSERKEKNGFRKGWRREEKGKGGARLPSLLVSHQSTLGRPVIPAVLGNKKAERKTQTTATTKQTKQNKTK